MIDLSPETELLARRVAAAQHRTIDDAIREALEVSAHTAGITFNHPRDTSARAVAERRKGAERYVAELAAMPILDTRPLQEIVDGLNAV